ncbi:MAG: hypothetical protein HYX49_03000 [Chloroflexi bacterium]|nr:hypothetical protein [Chloroflexota bacterium]
MFFQDAPPDTSGYMIAGYLVFFIVMAIYLISFFLRSRNLKQDLSVLEDMKQESTTTAGKATANKPAKSKTTSARSKKKK